MTAEEKARELAHTCFPDELNIWARDNVEAKNAELSCLAMYNWAIDKVCRWLETSLHHDNVGGFWADYANVNEFINALKKEMQ